MKSITIIIFVVTTMLSLYIAHFLLTTGTRAESTRTGKAAVKDERVLLARFDKSANSSAMPGYFANYRNPVNAGTPEEVLRNTGSIIIKTEPSLAKLYVDGKFMGDTPYKFTGSAGKYELTILQNGFISRKETVKVYNGKTLILKFNLDRAVAHR